MWRTYGTLYLALCFLTAGLVSYQSYREAPSGVMRQQLKWLTGGTLAGSLLVSLLYILPLAMGVTLRECQQTRSTAEPFRTGTATAEPVTRPESEGTTSITIAGERDSCGMMFSAAARPRRMSSAGTSASRCWLVYEWTVV